MRSKTELIKSASTLKEFSAKIKQAQIGETLTPESVQDIALEMLKQASRLLDNCCYLEPSEEDHLRHRGELNADIYRDRVSED